MLTILVFVGLLNLKISAMSFLVVVTSVIAGYWAHTAAMDIALYACSVPLLSSTEFCMSWPTNDRTLPGIDIASDLTTTSGHLLDIRLSADRIISVVMRGELTSRDVIAEEFKLASVAYWKAADVHHSLSAKTNSIFDR